MISWIRKRLNLKTNWSRSRALIAAIGVRAAITRMVNERIGDRLGSEYWIRPRQVIHPLCVRRRSSDDDVFHQIFIGREYGCLDDMTNVRLVLDCGANVGYSSAYFLSQFPQCQVIAVEPDPDNFKVTQRNLSAYGDRAKLVHAGVWSRKARLSLAQSPYRDGRAWAKQVRLSELNEESEFEGVDIESLLDSSDHKRISLLKMDIEGAEAVVFSENADSWLDKTDAIAIELHDDSIFGPSTEIFYKAISGHGFRVSRSGELTICRRPELPVLWH